MNQTPVWHQPLLAQTAVPDVEVVDEIESRIDEPDQPDEAPLHPPPHPNPQPPQPHHPPPPAPLCVAEAHWPETARLVHPTRGGKWSLLAQNNSIQAVVQDAILLVFRHIASVDSFPSGGDKVKLTRDSLYQAAETGDFDEITDRLSRDRNFGQWLSPLVCTHFLISSPLLFNLPVG